MYNYYFLLLLHCRLKANSILSMTPKNDNFSTSDSFNATFVTFNKFLLVFHIYLFIINTILKFFLFVGFHLFLCFKFIFLGCVRGNQPYFYHVSYALLFVFLIYLLDTVKFVVQKSWQKSWDWRLEENLLMVMKREKYPPKEKIFTVAVG